MDPDHLMADPVFNASRCSKGGHPLRSFQTDIFHAGLLGVPSWKWRAVSQGCLWHLCTDFMD
ncbi:MAG: DUF6122 family protein [Desulfobacteraceae bacterium]